MSFLRNKQDGKGQLVPTIILFCFLVVMCVSFISVLISESKPKYVSIDLKKSADNVVGDIPDPTPIKTELLQPQKSDSSAIPPIAQFIANTPVFVGDTVTYEDQSYDKELGGSIVNRHWEGKEDFFTKAGSYTVSLKVQDDRGQWSETVSHVINVLDKPLQKYSNPPVALFKATNPVYVGENVIYEDASFDPNGEQIVNRVWEGKQNSFNSAGNHKVMLRVENAKGKWSDPVYQVIEVKERPIVKVERKPVSIFNVSDPVYLNQPVIYTDKSFDQDLSDTIVNREWSANKKDSYDKAGKYDITLRVQDNHGQWSEPFTRTINVIESPNLPPVANFEVQSVIYVDDVINWKNTSYDSDGAISKEQWGGDKRYLYHESGEYPVTLTVWDDKGVSSSITKKIVILDKHNQLPVSKFRTNDPIYENDKVYYWDDSYDSDGKIVKREWSGDKRDSYSKEGNYNVTLTVWDNNGSVAYSTKTIYVLPKTNLNPVAQIGGPQTVNVNETVTFSDESYDSDGYIVSNSWGAKKLTKTWTKAGTYYVSLEVTDNLGTKSKVDVSVYVKDIGYPPSGN